MPTKVLFVVTNHGDLGTTGNKTGWYLPEVAHPYDVMTKAGYPITFVSPKGGKAPMDPGSAEAFKADPVCQAFLNDGVAQLDTTLAPSAVTASDYKALFYAGGHGPMWDIPDDKNIKKLAEDVYNQGGILGAVCHGTVGFVPLQLPNGDYLVKGKKVTCFTNAEEEAVGLTKVMPFLLETRLKERGANFVGLADWACNVQVSDRLVSGQNPASAGKVAEEMAKLIK